MLKGKCTSSNIAYWVLIIGGLNWGLVGLGDFFSSNWNVINIIFGGIPYLEAIIYVAVGIAAVVGIFGCRCKSCKTEAAQQTQQM